jgi:vesicular inhibitory amino acid transporter
MLGIVSILWIVGAMFVDGLSKRDGPGSLWSPAETQLGIGNWVEMGVAFGLFMAGVQNIFSLCEIKVSFTSYS